MQMKTPTPMRYFLMAVLLIASACNPASKVSSEEPSGSATAYVTSTRQLKSNKIPDSIFQITTMRRLTVNGGGCNGSAENNNVRDNANCWMIREIPAGIANLQQLLLLELKANDLHTIPQELAYLPKLKTLDLSDNPALTNINPVTKLVNLEYLYLYGCDLQVLPADIGDLIHLKQLGLAGNRIGAAEQERIRQALPNCKIAF
jgi:Leucine-rich repeat (LRR) protein